MSKDILYYTKEADLDITDLACISWHPSFDVTFEEFINSVESMYGKLEALSDSGIYTNDNVTVWPYPEQAILDDETDREEWLAFREMLYSKESKYSEQSKGSDDNVITGEDLWEEDSEEWLEFRKTLYSNDNKVTDINLEDWNDPINIHSDTNPEYIDSEGYIGSEYIDSSEYSESEIQQFAEECDLYKIKSKECLDKLYPKQ